MGIYDRTRNAGIVALVGGALFAADLDAEPRTISLTPNSATVENAAIVKVQLLDRAGIPVEPTKATPITLRARSEDGSETIHKAVIEPGQSSREIELPIPWGGAVEIQVESRELRGGSTLIQSVLGTGKREASEPPAADALRMRPRNETDMAPAEGDVAEGSDVEAESGESISVVRPAREPPMMSVLDSQSAPITESQARVGLRMYLRPQLDILADGVERATVRAFVMPAGTPAPVDLEVGLVPTFGTIAPDALKIPAGSTDGFAYLTSNRPGTIGVSVEPRGAFDVLQVDQPFAVTFAPPIAGLDVLASPSQLYIFERGQVIIRLVDSNGDPVATDVERRVDFVVNGPGVLTNQTVNIGPNESTARTEFVSRRPGLITVRAHTPSFAEQATEINVSIPWLLAGISFLMGAIGGAIRFARKRDEKYAIVIGIFVGPVGYLVAIIFDLLPFPVMNIPGAFGVSLFAGWLGAELLEMMGNWIKRAIQH